MFINQDITTAKSNTKKLHDAQLLHSKNLPNWTETPTFSLCFYSTADTVLWLFPYHHQSTMYLIQRMQDSLSSTSWTQVAIQVTRRTACAVIGESLLRQNCSHGSLFLSESAASKSVFDRTSGEHLQYAVCKSITSFRAASRASGSLSFNCAAASWMSGSIPYCLIPSAPWKTLS